MSCHLNNELPDNERGGGGGGGFTVDHYYIHGHMYMYTQCISVRSLHVRVKAYAHVMWNEVPMNGPS